MIFRHCYKKYLLPSKFSRDPRHACLLNSGLERHEILKQILVFFACSSDMNGLFLREETVPLYVFPSVLIISLFITLKKICCNF